MKTDTLTLKCGVRLVGQPHRVTHPLYTDKETAGEGNIYQYAPSVDIQKTADGFKVKIPKWIDSTKVKGFTNVTLHSKIVKYIKLNGRRVGFCVETSDRTWNFISQLSNEFHYHSSPANIEQFLERK